MCGVGIGVGCVCGVCVGGGGCVCVCVGGCVCVYAIDASTLIEKVMYLGNNTHPLKFKIYTKKHLNLLKLINLSHFSSFLA